MEPLKLYIRDIKNIPLLTAEEELKIAKRIKRGDAQARRIMIRSNLRLVINIAKQYSRFGLPLLDLIEDGNLGLMKAVSKFDPKRGYRFSTYAAWWIRQHVTRSLADQGKTVRIPVYMVETLSRFRKANERLTHNHRRKPSVSELARAMKLPTSKIREIQQIDQGTTSLDQTVGEEGEASVMDLVEDPKTGSSQESINQMIRSERIANLLEKMSPRERAILELRFGLTGDEPRTLHEVAKKFRVTRERIRQIEEMALKKLRAIASSQTRDI